MRARVLNFHMSFSCMCCSMRARVLNFHMSFSCMCCSMRARVLNFHMLPPTNHLLGVN